TGQPHASLRVCSHGGDLAANLLGGEALKYPTVANPNQCEFRISGGSPNSAVDVLDDGANAVSNLVELKGRNLVELAIFLPSENTANPHPDTPVRIFEQRPKISALRQSADELVGDGVVDLSLD